MSSRSLIVFRLGRPLSLMAIVGAYFLAYLPLAIEGHRFRVTETAIETTRVQIEAYPCLRNDCHSYPEARNAAELARKLGPTLGQQVVAVDGWGRPLQIASGPEGYVIVSTGADGKVDDDVRPLLQMAQSGGRRIVRLAAALEATNQRQRQAGNLARTSWYDKRDRDIVYANGRYIAFQPWRDDPEERGVVLRLWLAFALPLLVVFIALDLISRRLSGQPLSRAVFVTAGRAGQLLCLAGLLAPFYLARIWVTNRKAPARATLDHIISTADAIERFSCARKECEQIADYAHYYDCILVCRPFPVASSAAELARAVGPAYAARVDARDGWGHPLRIKSWGTHYVIASGGADGKIDPLYDVLFKVPPGDDARFEALAVTLSRQNQERFSAAYQALYKRSVVGGPLPDYGTIWYGHLDDDFVYADGRYVIMFSAERGADSSSEAPRAVVQRYALAVSLPSFIVLIFLTIAIERGRERPGRWLRLLRRAWPR